MVRNKILTGMSVCTGISHDQLTAETMIIEHQAGVYMLFQLIYRGYLESGSFAIGHKNTLQIHRVIARMCGNLEIPYSAQLSKQVIRAIRDTEDDDE